MFKRVVIAAAILSVAILLQIPQPAHFTETHLFELPNAEAQNIGFGGNPNSDAGAIVNGSGAAPGTGNVTVIGAPVAGVRIYVYQAGCMTTGTTAIVALIKDGASGSTKTTIPCAAASAGLQFIPFNPPIPLTGGTALVMAASPAPNVGVQFYASGRTAK